MGHGKRRRRARRGDGNHTAKIVAIVAVSALGVGALALGAAALSTLPSTPTTAHSAAPVDSYAVEAPIPDQIGLADVLPRLRDTSRAFNVVVFSDSTGAGRETWTALTGEWLGEKYGRTVEGQQWDIHDDPNGYRGSKWNLSKGDGVLVNWWNGASAGEDAVYSLANIDAIAPIPGNTVDLVFINHGHNHSDGELVTEVSDLVEEAVARYPNAAITIVLQNPEASSSPHQPTQKREIFALRQWTERRGYPMIDVWTPFTEQDVDSMLDDTLYHPTQAGYQFWADVVTAQLDAADPAPVEQ